MGNNRFHAHVLANQDYLTLIMRDHSDPRYPVFRARNYELPGCVAEAETAEDALDRLREKRVNYIEYLLDTGLSVPVPHLHPRDSTRQLEHVLV